jgi:hypothetical protein
MAERAEQDTPWKLLLRKYFREAVEFFFPVVATKVDWSVPPEFLDKEFAQIAPDAKTGKRFADQLVKLRHRNGQPIFLLIHLEVQAAKDKGFELRMLTYWLRIFDYFQQMPISLAILCDGNQDWRPDRYQFELDGTRLDFQFTSVKLLDYRQRWADLEASRNPFAKVVMAQLRTLETRNNKVQRKVWKFSLVRQLHEEGYNRQEIQDLFRFVNWIMQLPKPLEIEFWQEVLAYEEARKMTYMTNLERALVEQKLQEVRSEERQEIALNLLRKNYPLEEIAEVTFLSIEELQSLRNTLASNS